MYPQKLEIVKDEMKNGRVVFLAIRQRLVLHAAHFGDLGYVVFPLGLERSKTPSH